MNSHILAIALLSTTLVQAQEPAPSAEKAPAGTAAQAPTMSREQLLSSARKVALIGAVGHVAEYGIAMNPSAKKAQESLEKEVGKWGRFTVVESPVQADLVLFLFEGNRAAGGGGTIRTARLAVFPGGPPPKRGDVPLWDGDASGGILATSGAPKVIAKFRAYLEDLDKTVPAVKASAATPSAPTKPAAAVASESTSAAAPDIGSTEAKPVAAASPKAWNSRPTKYFPPYEIIGQAKTFTMRGKGAAGKQGVFDKAFGVGKYSDVQSAMGDIYRGMQIWGRMEYVEEVPKADLVIVVYQWDTRVYSKQFHGVQSAIQVAEGGEAFQREDPALWASGTANGTARDLIANLRFELDQYSQKQQLQATHAANKQYERGCDSMESAENKKEKYVAERNELLFEAIAELRQSLRNDYGYAPAHERLGTALRQLGFDSDAAYEYKLALQLQPGMQEALKGLASALTSIRDYDEGVQVAQELIRTGPDKADNYMMLGKLQYLRKDYVASAAAYREAIRVDPRRADAQAELGRALYRDKHMEEAEAAFREVLRLQPNNEEAMVWLGSTLNEEHKSEEAVAVLRNAEKINPKHGETHYEMARALRAQKRYEEAIAELKLALEVEPTATTYHAELAHALVDAGKNEAALAKFREISKNIPDSPAAHVDLGVMLLKLGQTNDAVKELERAIQLDQRCAPAYYHLGRAREAMGDRDGARQAYEMARTIDPENTEFQSIKE